MLRFLKFPLYECDHTHTLMDINIVNIDIFEKDELLIPFCAGFDFNNEVFISFYDDDDDDDVLKIVILNLIKKSNNIDEQIFLYDLNFDGIIIIENLTKHKLNFQIKAINGEIYWIKLTQINKIIIFRCFYKILPVSFKRISQIENLENLKLCDDVIKKEEIIFKKEEKISNCLTKIKILKECLMKLSKIIKNINQTALFKCYSAPSISFFIFFKNFNSKNIDKKLKNSLDDYCRKSYKGGRCEVFGNPLENEIVKYFDFPGMYGLIMKEKFHNGKWEFKTNVSFFETGFHTVTYKSNNLLPILPSYSTSNKLLFKNGVFTDTVWFEELLYFVENGGEILESHHSLVFEKFEEVFNEYSDYFFRIKKEGGYQKIFAKIMINSLYGGLALRKESIFNYITFSEAEFIYLCENLNIDKFYKVNNVYVVLINMDHKFKSLYKNSYLSKDSNRNVSYSAAITAKARIKLHKFFIEIEKNKGRILYCDTDSVFAAYDNSNLENKIGEFEWLSFYKDAVFAAPKSYALQKFNDEEIIKIKGISSKNLNFENFKSYFYENKEIEFLNQTTISKKNLILNKKNSSKNINFGEYDKREFSKNKKYTTPINTDLQ